MESGEQKFYGNENRKMQLLEKLRAKKADLEKDIENLSQKWLIAINNGIWTFD